MAKIMRKQREEKNKKNKKRYDMTEKEGNTDI